MLKVIMNEVKKIAYRSDVDIVGHIDLLTKFNENEEFIDFDDQEYLKLAYECIDMLIESKENFRSQYRCYCQRTKKNTLSTSYTIKIYS